MILVAPGAASVFFDLTIWAAAPRCVTVCYHASCGNPHKKHEKQVSRNII